VLTNNDILNPMADRITLQLNGESHTCPAGLNVPQCLEHLGFNPRLVALEYNGEILHRQFWTTTEIRGGDRLEVVTIVGGG
jgi:sulfur carrier protein